MTIEGKKVLLAEDEKLNQMVLKRYLEKLKLRVEIADDGEIAIEMAKNETYDLFLLDINMPKMSGFDVAKLIREKYGATILIALTGCEYQSISEKLKIFGFDDYIEKPVSFNILNEKMDLWLKA